MEQNVTMKQIDKTMKEVCVGVDEREEAENELEQLRMGWGWAVVFSARSWHVCV